MNPESAEFEFQRLLRLHRGVNGDPLGAAHEKWRASTRLASRVDEIRVSISDHERVRATIALGDELLARGQCAEATSCFVAALQQSPVKSPQATALRCRLGELELNHDDASARAHLNEAVLALKDEPGAGLGHALNKLGIANRNLGHLEEARDCFERAVEQLELACGPQDVYLGRILGNLGIVHQKLGALDEARSCFERTVRIYETVLGPKDGQLARALYLLAILLAAKGEHQEAVDVFERAIAILESEGESGKDALCGLLTCLGSSLLQLERAHPALHTLLRAQAVCTEVLGAEHQTSQQVTQMVTTLETILAQAHPDAGR